ncbi:MAG TPA: CapA family protein [Clostridia bacterium]|nr:CapA family protein [Clostridia bacterium]
MKRYRRRMIKGYAVIIGAVVLAVALIVVGIKTFGKIDGAIQTPGSTPTPTHEVTQSPSPTPSAEPEPSNIVVIKAVGDIMIKSEQLQSAKDEEGNYSFEGWLDEIKPSLAGGDLVIANLEAVLNGRSDPNYSGTQVMMNTPASILTALKNAGINMLMTANSHSLDAGMQGVENTINEIKDAGMDYVGTYLSQQEHDTAFIKEINGIKIGVAAFTAETGDNINNVPEEMQSVVVIYINSQKVERMLEKVNKLKEAGAEFIIVYMHWGEPYSDTPTSTQRSIAQKLLDNGVNLILSSHTHSVQPIRYKDVTVNGVTKKAMVAYSLGNFLTDQVNTGRVKTNTGFILSVTIQKDENGNVSITDNAVVPTWINRSGTPGDYDYKVLPLGEYAAAEDLPEGISETVWAAMKSEWSRVREISVDNIPIKNS